MDAVNELLGKLDADIASEEQKFFDLRYRYEKEARQSREDEKYFYDKIGEAYATMMLVTADMRKLRMSVIKQMANIEACRPLKPIVINV